MSATDKKRLAREAKAIVALAFRNGPIEKIHAGKECPTWCCHVGYSKISQQEMKTIMKNAVDHLCNLLLLKATHPERFETQINFGALYTDN